MRKRIAFFCLFASTLALAGGNGKSDPRGESRKDPERQRASLEDLRAEYIHLKQRKQALKQERALGRLFKNRDQTKAFDDLRALQTPDASDSSTNFDEASAPPSALPAVSIDVRAVLKSVPLHSRESFAVGRLLKATRGELRTSLDIAQHDLAFAVFRTRTLDKATFDGLSPAKPTPASMTAATRVLVAMELFINALTGQRIGPGLSAENALNDLRMLATQADTQDPATAQFIDDVLLLIKK